MCVFLKIRDDYENMPSVASFVEEITEFRITSCSNLDDPDFKDVKNQVLIRIGNKDIAYLWSDGNSNFVETIILDYLESDRQIAITYVNEAPYSITYGEAFVHKMQLMRKEEDTEGVLLSLRCSIYNAIYQIPKLKQVAAN